MAKSQKLKNNEELVEAGTLFSGDVLVQIARHPGIHIKVVSQVGEMVVDSIEQIVLNRINEDECTECIVHVFDNAAPEWVLQARLTTALRNWKSRNEAKDNG